MAPDARAVQAQERLRRLWECLETTGLLLGRSRALLIASEGALAESYRQLERGEERRRAASQAAPEAPQCVAPPATR
jgi:hypothetical protein